MVKLCGITIKTKFKGLRFKKMSLKKIIKQIILLKNLSKR